MPTSSHKIAQAFFISVNAIWIPHLRCPCDFYGLEQHGQPIHACRSGERVCLGQVSEILWADPVPHALWLLGKAFSLLLGVHKQQQPEMRKIIKITLS